ncbi:predicted protein, partial [Arabidopsis lyrata subsp. lyrata]
NVTALYVEGLRRLVKYGPSIESLELLHRAERPIVYAAFAYGIFAICAGHYEEGRTAMHILALNISWLDEMVEIGEAVMAQIADLEPPLSGNYVGTYRYPEGDIPNCVHFACTMTDSLQEEQSERNSSKQHIKAQKKINEIQKKLIAKLFRKVKKLQPPDYVSSED